MSQPFEIHVGDSGFKYKVRTRDEDGEFDPSAAVVKELVFDMPGVDQPVVRTAQVEAGSGDEAGQWFLTYTVTVVDVDGSPAEFHVQPGRVTLQGYLEWPDGTKTNTSQRTTDDNGHELRVHRNLR